MKVRDDKIQHMQPVPTEADGIPSFWFNCQEEYPICRSQGLSQAVGRFFVLRVRHAKPYQMYDKKLYFGLEFRDNHLRCLAVGDMKPDGFDLCVTDGGCRLSFASYDIGVLQTSVVRDIVNSKIRMQL